MGQFESDDRVVDELGAKGLSLVGVFHAFFEANSGESKTLDDDANSFVVEVRHEDCFAACQLLPWHEFADHLPLNPLFSVPIKFSTGTLTSSKLI